MDQYIGKMLDNRYEILERIGTGGMAVVYKARCHRLNRLVAIKILKTELASDEDFLRRFQAESQAVAMLSHINIVSIYDVCRSDGLDYIVMELIDGMTLKQYMQKRGTPLNWREALHFITQIVRALGHAHSRGIVHRDIKPHNIMVLRDGSVKVTDFGIARLTSAAQATLTQEALGSVHYISPEQAKGSHVDGRSDLYSVGVMLYEMLTGRLPFEGETPVFVAIQHINSIPIAPRDLNPDIPEALEAITLKAMAPNPDQRYLSAEEFLEDLKEFRRNPGVAVVQPTVQAEEEEVDEPTMVVPLSNFGKAGAEAEKEHEKKTDQEPKGLDDNQAKGEKATKAASASMEKRRRREMEEEEEEIRPRRRGLPPALIGFFAVVIFLCAIGYFLYSFLLKDILTPPEEYTVPDLRGYTVEQISNNPSILAGFSIEVSHTISDAEYDAGEICRQQPSANDTVKDPDTVIYVTVSSGKEQMYIPNVINMEARKALQLLQNDMKLDVDQGSDYSDEIAKGYVMSCSLIEGTRVEKGDKVTIVISKGPKPITINVIPFIDVNIETARLQAEGLGLTVGSVDYYPSNQYAVDRVIWQSIPADTVVEPGTVINFWVSLGSETVPTDPVASPEPTPSPSEEIPIPTTGVDVPATVKTIDVDLSAYQGIVALRIVVGDLTIHDSSVDCAVTPTISRTVEGTGVQTVYIYINEELVNSYELNFNP